MPEQNGLGFLDAEVRSIVFYHFDRKPDAAVLWKALLEICEIAKLVPTNGYWSVDGQRLRTPPFKAMSRLVEKGEIDEYDSLGLISYYNRKMGLDTNAEIIFSSAPPASTLQIYVPHDANDLNNANSIAMKLLNWGTPAYGISYHLPYREGPSWFATGIRFSGLPEDMSERAGEFRSEFFWGKKISDGYFRDVFEWNYLSDVHLNREIDGKRMRDWISERSRGPHSAPHDRTRGLLTPTPNGGAIWTLTGSEIVRVRLPMLEAGLLMVKH